VKFAPIERLQDTAEGIWSWFQGEKRALYCLISIAKQSFSVHCHLRHLRGTLKIVFQLKLLNARASPQLREPDNLRTFVSSPLNSLSALHQPRAFPPKFAMSPGVIFLFICASNCFDGHCVRRALAGSAPFFVEPQPGRARPLSQVVLFQAAYGLLAHRRCDHTP
jgi:hypothetical protein